MKKLMTLFLVIEVLGIYGQTSESEIQVDTTQQADTVKINEQQNEDTSVIKENIESKGVSGKGNDDSLIMMKKNPWLYDWRYGCLTDGLTYLISMTAIHYMPYEVYQNYYPLDNDATQCIYPIGVVFVERIIKNIILKENRELFKAEKKIKIYAQTGFGLPYYASLFSSNEFAPFQSTEFSYINDIGISYISPITKKLNIITTLNYYTFSNKFSPAFVSAGVGLAINNFDISIEKVFLGKYKEISQNLYKQFVKNNYAIISEDNNYSVNFEYDFLGVSIGWNKKYKIWERLYIEPMLSYKFIYTFDFKSGSIVGFMGGLGIGYIFN